MPSYIVTLKKEASIEEVDEVKKQAQSNGGTIMQEFGLIKAFTVTYPEVTTLSFKDHPGVERIEEDQEAKTQ